VKNGSCRFWVIILIKSIFKGVTDEEAAQIKDALGKLYSSLFSAISENLSSNIEENIEAIDLRLSEIDELISEKQRQVDAEKQLAEEGKNNVLAIKENELKQLQSLQARGIAAKEEELKKQKKLQKELATVQAAAAAISMLSQAVSEGGVAGLLLGLAAGVTFLAEIAALYGKVDNVVNFGKGTAEVLGGCSHSQGGTSLGQYGTAERGEFLGILNKNKTQKYGKSMISLFDGINQSNEHKKLLGLSGLMEMREVNNNTIQEIELKEIPEIKGIYKEMKKQVKLVTFENGKRIEKQGNNTRVIYVN